VGRLVPHGLKDATVDLGTIREWWQREPDANVAIATGASGLVVVDVDPRHGGDESLARLEQFIGSSLSTALVETGGGGRHFIFKAPADSQVTNRNPIPGYEGIDVRADGGYIIGPGSRHASGRRYRWRDDIAPGPLPPRLRDLLSSGAKPAPRNAAHDGVVREGQRHSTLVRMAGTMRRAGFTAAAIEAALLEQNTSLDPPLDECEVRGIATSISRYETSAATTGPRPLRWTDDVSLAARPVPPMLVAPYIPERSVVVIPGAPAAGKTFLALGMALAIGTGRNFLGCTVSRSGPVVMVAAEGAEHLQKRIHAWKRSERMATDESANLYLVEGAIDLRDPEAVTQFITEASTRRPVMVILDTLARCTPGADENSAKDMGEAMAALDRIKVELQAAVVALHHTNASDTRERGSTAIRGAADVLLFVDRADDLLTVRPDKAKDTALPDALSLELNPIHGTDSCVLVRRGLGPSLTSNGRRLIRLLSDVHNNGATHDELKRTSKIPHSTFVRTLKTLQDLGHVSKRGRYYSLTWMGQVTAVPPGSSGVPNDGTAEFHRGSSV
jgi:hypothetical protein